MIQCCDQFNSDATYQAIADRLGVSREEAEHQTNAQWQAYMETLRGFWGTLVESTAGKLTNGAGATTGSPLELDAAYGSHIVNSFAKRDPVRLSEILVAVLVKEAAHVS